MYLIQLVILFFLASQKKTACYMLTISVSLMLNSENGLQQCLNRLHFYGNKWKLQDNMKKTKLMAFNISGRKIGINCKFGQQRVDIAKSLHCSLF